MRQNKNSKKQTNKQTPEIKRTQNVPENSGSQTRQRSLNRKSKKFAVPILLEGTVCIWKWHVAKYGYPY